MGPSAGEIAAVVREIAPVLTSGWVQKVLQPTPRAITLEIRAPGQTLSLFLSANPETARLHLLSHRHPNPATPPPFCQFLRAHIQGARIEGVEQIEGDRIVRIRMTAREGPCSFIAELTGRGADLLLLDSHDKILATLNTPREKVGKPYQPPISPARPQTRAGTWTSSDVDAKAFPSPDEDHSFPMSTALERRYQAREEEFDRARLRQARLAEVRKRIKKASRRIEALRTDLDKAARYRDYARYGELLKANLGKIHKGQERITVTDYFDPATPELVIPLDPSKSPRGNMDDYFKKHRKHLAAEREIRPRLAAVERELEALRAELTAIQCGTWEPPTSKQEKAQQVVLNRKTPIPKSKPTRSGPFRRFEAADGLPIYVGRNARENEELTFKLAKSDDLWLHAHGTPGSHVVVRLEKGADPPPETIKDAATLALLYSDLKKSGKGEVIYTRRKWVRKVKGRPPGTVTVTQEKSVFVTLDRVRLDRLKDSTLDQPA
ncbi:MAG: NFACT family protein [Nitrospirota bacterium]